MSLKNFSGVSFTIETDSVILFEDALLNYMCEISVVPPAYEREKVRTPHEYYTAILYKITQ